MSIYDHKTFRTSELLEEDIPELDFNFLMEMAENNLSIDDLEAYDEAVSDMIPGADKVETIKDHITNISDLKNQWKKVSDKFTMHKWIYRYIKDEKQEAMLHKYYDIICDDENNASGTKYTQYKKAYNFFCNFFGLPNKGTIIEWFTFDEDKTDKGQKKISIRYSRGLAKVHIPEGMLLYHTSPTKGITELTPAYKSKTKGKFLYPSKRVYFTVQKEINPFKYGMGTNKFISTSTAKLYKYTPAKEITQVFIDPTYAMFSERSVYVDTETPIKVIDISNAKKDIVGKEKVARESVWISESGYMNDIMLESLFEKKDSDSADEKEVKELMKNWKTSNQNHKKQIFKNDSLTEEEYDKLCDYYDDIRHAEDYKTYKKAFDGLCKFCHIVPQGTIITKCQIRSGAKENHNSIYVEYSANTKKIHLPDGMKLYHMSKVPNIKELIPVFRGKSAKGYIYDKPRVYFTIHKEMPKFLADYKLSEKMHKYECKENIRDVYVDPLVWNGNIQGAVYVVTNKPIPVEEMGIKKEGTPSEEEKK